MLDLTTVPGLRAAERLRSELVAWLTTVTPDGIPQTSPVWFTWDDEELLVRSVARTPRVRNIGANRHVSFHLDSDGEGGEIVTAEGEARLDEGGASAEETAAFRAKYDVKVREYGWTWAGFEEDYPTVIRIRPTRFRLY